VKIKMSANAEINDWCNKVSNLTKKLVEASRSFENLSDTYPEMRNMGFKNAQKERIDSLYSTLYETKNKLCGLKAGGLRKTRRKLKVGRT
jgi:hypothetical protein